MIVTKLISYAFVHVLKFVFLTEMECLPCDRCREVEWPEYRNKICAVLSGGLFTLGWWLAIGNTGWFQKNGLINGSAVGLIADWALMMDLKASL